MKKFPIYFCLGIFVWTSGYSQTDQATISTQLNEVAIEFKSIQDSMTFFKEQFQAGKMDFASYNEKMKELGLQMEYLGSRTQAIGDASEEIQIEDTPAIPDLPAMDPVDGDHNYTMNWKNKRNNKFGAGLDLGFYWYDPNNPQSTPKFNMWKSFHVDIQLRLRKNLGKGNLKQAIYYGLGYDPRQYEQDKVNDHFSILSVNDQGAPIFSEAMEGFKEIKSAKIDVGYITIPLGYELKKKKLGFSIGGYGGILVKRRQTLKGTTNLGEDKEVVLSRNYSMNNFTYGLQGIISYGALGIGVKYDLQPIFKNTDTYKMKPFGLGLLLRM